MSSKKEDERASSDLIKKGRRLLKSNWRLLDGATSDQARGFPRPDLEKPCSPDATPMTLPPVEEGALGQVSLRGAIAGRQSRRSFLPDALTTEELSFLLWATQGVRRFSSGVAYRTVPSAGARHALETYLYVARVDGVARGLYRYLPLNHSLCRLSGDADVVATALAGGLHGQLWDSAVLFVWSAVPYRMEWRYSVVSHKLIALDAGHVCQNLYLACEGIGCGTCAIGAYDQTKMNEAIGLDGREEFVVYAAPVGRI